MKATHTTWRVYCRHTEPCFAEPLFRLNRKKAHQAAQHHHDETGHATDVVKLRYETVTEIKAVQP